MSESRHMLECGKMEDILAGCYPDNTFDSIVTDPPYGLKFMAKRWDYNVPTVKQWEQALRVLKPGGYLLSFGGSRTFHRVAVNIEDAGFEIRDTIMWIYGSGFPKSMDISKAIDKAKGAEREVVGKREHPTLKDKSKVIRENATQNHAQNGTADEWDLTAPATDLAEQWQGWGTALKPAHEPIIVARKPLDGTVAENIEKWGVGGVNIDGCRIDGGPRPLREVHDLRDDVEYNPNALQGRVDGSLKSSKAIGETTLGRFPANVIHDGSDEVLAGFPHSKSGKPGIRRKEHNSVAMNQLNITGEVETGYGDEGSAARFFYCAKASKSDRNEGVDMSVVTEIGHNRFDKCEDCGGTILQNPDRPSACRCENPVRKNNVMVGNHHPTVKPTSLMQYLVKLVTPSGGLILDPFMGSGSTGKAAIMEGFVFVGIDDDEKCIPLANQRIESGYETV